MFVRPTNVWLNLTNISFFSFIFYDIWFSFHPQTLNYLKKQISHEDLINAALYSIEKLPCMILHDIL